MDKKISFIIASYNYEQYIGQTIESIINQTIPDWEMLIIDDGSKDNSVEVINEYCQKDSRIKLLTHFNNENKGLIKTLQLGIKHAQGEYIVFLESDDYIREDYLEEKLAIFDKNEKIGLICNDIQTFGAELTNRKKLYFSIIRNIWNNSPSKDKITDAFHIRNIIPTFSCVMVKKSLMENINWDSPIPACIDRWLWVQIVNKADMFFINKKLTYWRIHRDSYLNRNKVDKETNEAYHTGIDFFLPPIKNLFCKFEFQYKQIQRFFEYIFIKNKKIG